MNHSLPNTLPLDGLQIILVDRFRAMCSRIGYDCEGSHTFGFVQDENGSPKHKWAHPKLGWRDCEPFNLKKILAHLNSFPSDKTVMTIWKKWPELNLAGARGIARHRRSVSSPMKKGYAAIEIDNHSGQAPAIAQQYNEILVSELITANVMAIRYIELNRATKGSHILGPCQDLPQLSRFAQEFSDRHNLTAQGLTIEVKRPGQYLRLPMSHSYEPYRMDSGGRLSPWRDSQENIITGCLTLAGSQPEPSSTAIIPESKSVPSVHQTVKPLSTGTDRKQSTPKHAFRSLCRPVNSGLGFPEGQRCLKMPIISFVAAGNQMSYMEFNQLVESLDRGSKDYREKPQHWREKDVLRWYHWGRDNYNKDKASHFQSYLPAKFVSNEHRVPEALRKGLKALARLTLLSGAESLLPATLNNREKLTIMHLLLRELYGSMLYQNSQEVIYDDDRLSASEQAELAKHFRVSRTWLDLFARSLGDWGITVGCKAMRRVYTWLIEKSDLLHVIPFENGHAHKFGAVHCPRRTDLTAQRMEALTLRAVYIVYKKNSGSHYIYYVDRPQGTADSSNTATTTVCWDKVFRGDASPGPPNAGRGSTSGILNAVNHIGD